MHRRAPSSAYRRWITITAVSEVTGRSYNDGVPMGVFSYMATPTKPSGLADVLWGFDPAMFDHEKMKDAVLWESNGGTPCTTSTSCSVLLSS